MWGCTDSVTVMFNCSIDWDFSGIALLVMPFRAQSNLEAPKSEIMGSCVFKNCLFLLETLLPLSHFYEECGDEVIVCASEHS